MQILKLIKRKMGKIITLNVVFYIEISILYPIYYKTEIIHRTILINSGYHFHYNLIFLQNTIPTINYTCLCSANIIYAQNAYILN